MTHRIIYISTAHRTLSDDDLDAIIAVSRRNNSRDGLSGLLIYDSKRFFQYLEGEREALDRAVRRIRADDRHIAFVELSRGEVAAPQFGEWDMADYRATAGQSLSATVADLTQRCEPFLASQLRGFASVRGNAA